MIEKDYLPQYAAEAVSDLRRTHDHLVDRRIPGYTEARAACGRASLGIAETIEKAAHIVLPPNGEIYRENKGVPTKEEGMSFVGIPAPIVSIESLMSYSSGLQRSETTEKDIDDGSLYAARSDIKMKVMVRPDAELTLVIDYKQLYPETYLNGGEERSPVAIISLAKFKRPFESLDVNWVLNTWGMMVFCPFEIQLPTPEEKELYGWIYKTPHHLFNLYEYLNGVDELTKLREEDQAKQVSTLTGTLSLVLQTCHALRVGATLEQRVDKSYTRNRTFQKKGVGGFEYHVLKLPHGTVKETLGSRVGVGGDRDGPRYHFRRAHLRNLSSGAQTFVRSCFVGNRDKGVVEKNYQIGNSGEAA